MNFWLHIRKNEVTLSKKGNRNEEKAIVMKQAQPNTGAKRASGATMKTQKPTSATIDRKSENHHLDSHHFSQHSKPLISPFFLYILHFYYPILSFPFFLSPLIVSLKWPWVINPLVRALTSLKSQWCTVCFKNYQCKGNLFQVFLF